LRVGKAVGNIFTAITERLGFELRFFESVFRLLGSVLTVGKAVSLNGSADMGCDFFRPSTGLLFTVGESV
jgi:hypothetical protein